VNLLVVQLHRNASTEKEREGKRGACSSVLCLGKTVCLTMAGGDEGPAVFSMATRRREEKGRECLRASTASRRWTGARAASARC